MQLRDAVLTCPVLARIPVEERGRIRTTLLEMTTLGDGPSG